MSIPTMFSPVNYEGMMLVDGGSVNNLPANHLRDLGCDIIIGVNVSAPFERVGNNPSMAEILGCWYLLVLIDLTLGLELWQLFN